MNGRVGAERQGYENQIRELRQRIIDLEGNLSLISAEIARLNVMISDKNNEIEIWKGKVGTVERLREQEVREIRQRFEVEQRSILERELRAITEQFNNERSQYEVRMKDVRLKIVDYENKFTYLSVEIDRLNALYEEKLKENESWRQRYQNLEHSNFAEFEEVRIQIESLKRNSMVIILMILK